MRSQKFAVHSERMENDEDQRPEGALLAKKLLESGLSARKASAKMRITDTRLRHIINGYQPVGRGQRIEVVAPGDTLADIALALDVTPEEMAATGRVDAAEVMRKILGDRPMEFATPGDRPWNQILAEHEEIREWAAEGLEVHLAPDAILPMLTDDQLLAEIGRRMREGSPFVSVPDDDVPEGGERDDSSATTTEPLSVVDDSVDHLIAADQQETSISGEQEESETP